MSDCANVEMRELLPELVHDRLDAATHARVTAHLAACSECQAELELLQTARQALRPIMPLDKRAIVAALPLPRNRQATRPLASRRVWRIAAAITVIALGGVSFTTMRQLGGPDMALVDSARNSGDTGAAQPESVLAIADTPVAAPEQAGVAGVVIDLADEDLETLIGELDKLEAAPRVDPDANRFGRMVAGITGGD
jgi:anti-sigma factor RsiW